VIDVNLTGVHNTVEVATPTMIDGSDRFRPNADGSRRTTRATRAAAGRRRSGCRVFAARARLVVAATRPALVRRLFIAGMERGGPGLSTNLACRKSYIGDKLDEARDSIDAVVVLGAGSDTRAYPLAHTVHIPIFEVDQPVNIARKKAAVRRALGEQPRSSVGGVGFRA
jgi:methyltransferase (TIGR00027 family)